MKIKRFFAKDMKSALQEVKEVLGTDAVIMSNKKVVGGIEIVAAVDDDGTQLPQITRTQDVLNQNSFIVHDDHVQLSSLNRMRLNHSSDHYSQIGGNSMKYQNTKMQEPMPGFSKMFNQAQKQSPYHQNVYDQGDYDEQLFDQRPKQRSEHMSERIPERMSYSRNSYDRQGDNNKGTQTEANSLSSLLKRQQSSLFSERDKERLLSKSKITRNYQPVIPPLDPTRYDKNSPNNAQKELMAMREEISSIRQLLQHQVSGLMWQEVERQDPLRAMLIKRLEKMGISSELADQLAGYIPNNALPHQIWNSVLSLLSDQLIISKKDILSEGGVIALLGPTGVGKTTTVAKLAAKAAMTYGADNVALITTDTYRIGAHEQLATYGRILGCPVKVASTSDELNQALFQLRNRRLVLLDTAGMGQRDVRLSEQLDNLMKNSGTKISSLLVLAATSQRRVLQETVDHFKQIPLAGCVLTKLDESLSLGELITVTIENALPIAYLADGQRVPEDLQMADRQFLIERADELLTYDLKQEAQFWLDRSPDVRFGHS